MKNRKRTTFFKKQTGLGTAQALKKTPNGKYNQHNRDISSKNIFDNRVLCAQFLRDNFDIPLLKNVQPEDIEDISERYHPYLGTELEADSVKKIRILDIEKKNEPPFLVSLIDHKSLVDYDAAMQLLRYMMCIWTAYKGEMEKKHKGITKRKSFRYPVIIPIIYYEGKSRWTACRNFCGRIGNSSEFQKWIPNFQYELVSNHEQSNQELLERGDEMSLIMLINKIQNAADLEQLLHIPVDKINRILKNSPEHVVDVMVSVMESLCFKIDVSAEERMECVQKVRERKMGYLWENMEKFSIQEERRKTEEQRKKAEAERENTEAERKKAETAQKEAKELQERVKEQQKLLDIEHQKNSELEDKLKAAETLIKQLSGSRQERN